MLSLNNPISRKKQDDRQGQEALCGGELEDLLKDPSLCSHLRDQMFLTYFPCLLSLGPLYQCFKKTDLFFFRLNHSFKHFYLIMFISVH